VAKVNINRLLIEEKLSFIEYGAVGMMDVVELDAEGVSTTASARWRALEPCWDHRIACKCVADVDEIAGLECELPHTETR
jgi:hypothetical protein